MNWLVAASLFWVVAAVAALLSMFRNRPIYLARKALGLPVRRSDGPPEAVG